MGKKHFNLYLEASQREWAFSVSRQTGNSVADLVRRALHFYLQTAVLNEEFPCLSGRIHLGGREGK